MEFAVFVLFVFAGFAVLAWEVDRVRARVARLERGGSVSVRDCTAGGDIVAVSRPPGRN